MKLLTISLVIFNLAIKSIAQLNPNIVLLDKKFEKSEPAYYHGLSYLNSNFTNMDSIEKRYASSKRAGRLIDKHSCEKVEHIPTKIRREFRLSYFYQKYTHAFGIPVISSNKVSQSSLKRACYVLRFFLTGSNELKEIFFRGSLRVVVLGSSESVLELPEYEGIPSGWLGVKSLGPTRQIPVLAVSDENLQCSVGDSFR